MSAFPLQSPIGGTDAAYNYCLKQKKNKKKFQLTYIFFLSELKNRENREIITFSGLKKNERKKTRTCYESYLKLRF